MSVCVASFVMVMMALSCLLLYVKRGEPLIALFLSSTWTFAKPAAMVVGFMCGMYACYLAVYIALKAFPA